jgi:hypothetical protein
MNGFEGGFTNYLSLRADLLQRAAAVRARFDAYDREFKKLDAGLASLKQARSFTDFSSAINSMASSEFSSAPAAMAAAAVQRLGASEELALRSLLNATNPATWAFIKKAGTPNLVPEIAMPAERSMFEQWNSDPAITANHQRYRFCMDAAKTRSVEWITAGALDGSLGWKQIKAWEVSPDAAHAAFEDHDYGNFNGQWKLSATQPVYRLEQLPNLRETSALAAAELGKVWPGGDTYARPLLQALDAVRDSGEGSPVFRAYLFCELVKLMEFQPDEWGLSFCPSARTQAAQIHSLVGGEIASGDWFVPAKIAAWSDKLDRFFAAPKTISFVKEASGNLALAQAVVRDGLHYVGFAGLDGKPVITAAQRPADVWGYDAATGKPVLVSTSAMPLSPLFALTSPRADYLARAGVDPNSPSFGNSLLPLFRPKN